MKVFDHSFLQTKEDMNCIVEQHFTDYSYMSGNRVSMFYRDEDGPWGLHHQDHNVVVQGSRNILAQLLANGRAVSGGGLVSDYSVSKCKFGNGGYANNLLVAVPALPTIDDVALVDQNPLVIEGGNFVVSSVSLINSPEWGVTFQITIPADQGNSYGEDNYWNLTEMALFSGNDIMYARKTFPSFLKVLGRMLVVFWTIIF